jgi:hypothetical protein
LAQLVAHLLCKQGVRGSSPLGSTSTPRGVPRRPTAFRLAAALAVLLALAPGCGEIPAPDVEPAGPPIRPSGTPTYDARREPAAAVLPYVPRSATTLRVIDLDEVRRQLGVPELTGADQVGDRAEFWRRAQTEAPLLAQGMLRPFGSELGPAFGFTEDDVDWEAQFTGPTGHGFVLAFRSDLDMGAVARAVQAGVGPLAGATVRPRDHLLLAGVAADGSTSWAADPALVRLVGERAEATYLRRGCVPLDRALGPDGTADDRRAVLARQDVRDLADLAGFAVSFGDHLATVRLGPDRADLFDRLHLGEDWPVTGDPAFGDGFARAVGDPGTGRIGYHVPRPLLAARMTLSENLPFGVCNAVTPIANRTGP